MSALDKMLNRQNRPHAGLMYTMFASNQPYVVQRRWRVTVKPGPQYYMKTYPVGMSHDPNLSRVFMPVVRWACGGQFVSSNVPMHSTSVSVSRLYKTEKEARRQFDAAVNSGLSVTLIPEDTMVRNDLRESA